MFKAQPVMTGKQPYSMWEYLNSTIYVFFFFSWSVRMLVLQCAAINIDIHQYTSIKINKHQYTVWRCLSCFIPAISMVFMPFHLIVCTLHRCMSYGFHAAEWCSTRSSTFFCVKWWGCKCVGTCFPHSLGWQLFNKAWDRSFSSEARAALFFHGFTYLLSKLKDMDLWTLYSVNYKNNTSS